MFGLAISKITFGVPLIIYLVIKRCWTVVIIGLAVQVLGLFALSLLVDASPLTIYDNFMNGLRESKSAEATWIDLIHLAAHIPHSEYEFYGIGAAFSLLVFGILWWSVLRHRVNNPIQNFGIRLC